MKNPQFKRLFFFREEEKKFLEERDRVLEGKPGQEWANVGTLVDFKATKMEGKDTTRMRKILIEMKQK